MTASRECTYEREQGRVNTLLAECGELPATPPDRIPLGPGADGVMRWSPFPLPLTEIVGGSRSGKTTSITRIIAYLATLHQDPGAILLLAGDREIDAARARWAEWPQVAVYGREDADRLVRLDESDLEPLDRDSSAETDPGDEGDFPLVVVFDDWFTERDGTLRRCPEDSAAQQRMEMIEFLRALDDEDGLPVIAAFRPGHVSQRDESGDIEDQLDETETFLPVDDFAPEYWNFPAKSVIEEAIVSPQDEAGRYWAQTRHFRAHSKGPHSLPDAHTDLRLSLLGGALSKEPLGDMFEEFEAVVERMGAEYLSLGSMRPSEA